MSISKQHTSKSSERAEHPRRTRNKTYRTKTKVRRGEPNSHMHAAPTSAVGWSPLPSPPPLLACLPSRAATQSRTCCTRLKQEVQPSPVRSLCLRHGFGAGSRDPLQYHLILLTPSINNSIQSAAVRMLCDSVSLHVNCGH